MTKSEYHELVDYLGVMFGRIDQRFEAIETRLTRAEIFGESLRDDIRGVADGVLANSARLDRLEVEMRAGFAGLDRRIMLTEHRLGRIDERLEGIDERLGGIDERLDGVEQRLAFVEAHSRSVDSHLESIERRLTVA